MRYCRMDTKSNRIRCSTHPTRAKWIVNSITANRFWVFSFFKFAPTLQWSNWMEEMKEKIALIVLAPYCLSLTNRRIVIICRLSFILIYFSFTFFSSFSLPLSIKNRKIRSTEDQFTSWYEVRMDRGYYANRPTSFIQFPMFLSESEFIPGQCWLVYWVNDNGNTMFIQRTWNWQTKWNRVEWLGMWINIIICI